MQTKRKSRKSTKKTSSKITGIMSDWKDITNGKSPKGKNNMFTKKQTHDMMTRLDTIDKLRLFSIMWLHGKLPENVGDYGSMLTDDSQKGVKKILEINRLGFFTNDGQPAECDIQLYKSRYVETQQKPYMSGWLQKDAVDHFGKFLQKKGWFVGSGTALDKLDLNNSKDLALATSHAKFFAPNKQKLTPLIT
jgi:hypothetical protein